MVGVRGVPVAAEPDEVLRARGERVVPNDELVGPIDSSDEWIQQRTGIRQRHIAADGEFTSHLATKAAQRALDRAGMKVIIGVPNPALWGFVQAAVTLNVSTGRVVVKSSRIAGSRVTARTAAIAIAKFLVNASGLNRRPSWASSVNTGRNATAITSSAKKLGPPTSFTAEITTLW